MRSPPDLSGAVTTDDRPTTTRRWISSTCVCMWGDVQPPAASARLMLVWCSRGPRVATDVQHRAMDDEAQQDER